MLAEHPTSSTTAGAPDARGGFTLLELVLVLAIIVLIGALAVPSLGEVFERQKLQGAAQELRLKWDRARLEAMRTGQAQVFQCTIGQRDYSLGPWVLESDIANAGSGATVMTGAGTLVETQANGFFTAAGPTEPEPEQLEENLSFVSCLVAGDMRAYTTAQDSQSTRPGMSDVNTQTVGQSVIFYPDGSTSTAEVRIQNQRGDVRAIQLRGLTGHCRVVDITNVPSAVEESRP